MASSVPFASAQSAPPAPAQAPQQQPAAVPKQTPLPAPVVRTPDPELDMPDTDTAKRVTGYAGDQAVGGADCRTTCDKAYYLCLSNDDSGQCPAGWTRCLTACPAHSSNF